MRSLSRLFLFLFIAFYLIATVGYVWYVGRETEFERGDGTQPPTQEIKPEPKRDASGKHTVLWISLDGFRHDYPSKANTPTLNRLSKASAWSTQYVPAFPSITFPSHASTSTGTPASAHGVTSNTFYDSADQELYRFPSQPELLKTEPIWTTATRQDVPTCVHDWPFSQGQTGKWKAAAFHEKFQMKLNATERFSALAEAYRESPHEAPYRLLMGYAAEADKAGHEHGPDSPEVVATIEMLDSALEELLKDTMEQFDATRGEGDQLYFFLTTDHGMAEVDYNVNIDSILGPSLDSNLVIAKSGNVANLFVVPEPTIGTATSIIDDAEKALSEYEFASTYRRDSLPPQWSYAHPTRTGDLVVVLDKGYTFNSSQLKKVYPTGGGSTLLGMHGYPPEENSDMWGFSLFWRYPEPLTATGDIGRVDALQIYPTICEILGITPSDEAQGNPIPLR